MSATADQICAATRGVSRISFKVIAQGKPAGRGKAQVRIFNDTPHVRHWGEYHPLKARMEGDRVVDFHITK